ncbi:PLT2 [Symbiodinium natans]|uniref:PLT2 protein n=1 Tax=Symbiodinium natans TaxID=878477 RepID=A0A812TKM9_9DINO|nr:PLT2 [Symbiodinium natans]
MKLAVYEAFGRFRKEVLSLSAALAALRGAASRAKKAFRMMKAVKDEGMPTYKNPFVHGNLFLILTIEPGASDSWKLVQLSHALSYRVCVALLSRCVAAERHSRDLELLDCSLLGQGKAAAADDKDVEIHTVTDIDPVQSFNSNKAFSS